MSATGMTGSRLRALYEKILIKPIPEEQSHGGILMVPLGPHSKVDLRMAEVVSVGDGGERIDGTHITREHRVKPGDVVVYAFTGTVPILVTVEDKTTETGWRREEWRYTTVDHIYGVVEAA